jgi:hypothetical protein
MGDTALRLVSQLRGHRQLTERFIPDFAVDLVHYLTPWTSNGPTTKFQ